MPKINELYSLNSEFVNLEYPYQILQIVDTEIGLITGIIGLVICVLNYPIYAYIKSNKENK